MNKDYLEWINKSYRLLVDNPNMTKLELKTPDGKISVYRVVNIIRTDINLSETHK